MAAGCIYVNGEVQSQAGQLLTFATADLSTGSMLIRNAAKTHFPVCHFIPVQGNAISLEGRSSLTSGRTHTSVHQSPH